MWETYRENLLIQYEKEFFKDLRSESNQDLKTDYFLGNPGPSNSQNSFYFNEL